MVLFLVALAVTWGALTTTDLAVMLIMLAATSMLSWKPWPALAAAFGYYLGWATLQVPWASMNLCGVLFVYNWFFHRREGMWLLAAGYPLIEMASWVARYGWDDLLANVLSSTGISVFAAVAGWLAGRRLDSEVKMRVESEEALRSTRLLMASELHDSVAQTQTLLVMNLEELTENPLLHQELIPQVRETLELSRQAAKELREAMAALRAVDRDFRLLGRPAGHSLERQWNQMCDALDDSGFYVQTRFDIDINQLSAELEHTISRLLGELTTNIVWHGAPGVCSVECFEEEAAVCIRTVNAVGKNEIHKSGGGGDGLVGIRQRVGMLGGTCDFGLRESNWVAEVKVPLRNAQ